MTDNTNGYPFSLQVLEPALAAILVSVRMTGYTLKAGYPERVPKNLSVQVCKYRVFLNRLTQAILLYDLKYSLLNYIGKKMRKLYMLSTSQWPAVESYL